MIITNEMKEAIAEIADTYGLNPQIDIYLFASDNTKSA